MDPAAQPWGTLAPRYWDGERSCLPLCSGIEFGHLIQLEEFGGVRDSHGYLVCLVMEPILFHACAMNPLSWGHTAPIW